MKKSNKLKIKKIKKSNKNKQKKEISEKATEEIAKLIIGFAIAELIKEKTKKIKNKEEIL